MTEPQRTFSQASLHVLVFLCSAGLSSCCKDSDDITPGSVTFTNETPFFVHLLHPVENQLFVPPGQQVTVFEVTEGAEVSVLFSPGQEVSGIVMEHAGCCTGDDFIDCASLTAKLEGDELFTDVSEPSCPSDGGGSCPYVFAGTGDALFGEMLVGAVHRAAAREDSLVLTGLAPEDGGYRVRLAAVLDETEHIDTARLELIEHAADRELVRDQQGGLWLVGQQQKALAVQSAAGRDLLNALSEVDEQRVTLRDRARKLDGEPRDWATLTFARPPGGGDRGTAYLLVRGRNSQLVQDSYYAYLRGFGPGLPKLMRLMSHVPGYATALSRYVTAAGLSLRVDVDGPGGYQSAGFVDPVGPAGDQTIALPMVLPAGTGPVRVRLSSLPGAWELDGVALGFDVQPAERAAQRLPTAVEWESVTAQATQAPMSEPATRAQTRSRLARADGERVSIATGQALVMRFEASGTERDGRVRTPVLHVHGYYEPADWSEKPCVDLGALASAMTGDGEFTRRVLARLAFEDVVARHAAEAGVTVKR